MAEGVNDQSAEQFHAGAAEEANESTRGGDAYCVDHVDSNSEGDGVVCSIVDRDPGPEVLAAEAAGQGGPAVPADR